MTHYIWDIWDIWDIRDISMRYMRYMRYMTYKHTVRTDLFWSLFQIIFAYYMKLIYECIWIGPIYASYTSGGKSRSLLHYMCPDGGVFHKDSLKRGSSRRSCPEGGALEGVTRRGSVYTIVWKPWRFGSAWKINHYANTSHAVCLFENRSLYKHYHYTKYTAYM